MMHKPPFRRLLLTLLLCFVVLELRTRVKDGALYYPGTSQYFQFELSRDRCASRFDDQLGWVPTEEKSGRQNVHRTVVNVKSLGLRSNGKMRELSEEKNLQGAILVVGDSYAFGDEVSDHETWPAYLEQIADRPVANAAACGYGLDQMYLRAKDLLPKIKPKFLIIGLNEQELLRNTQKSSQSNSAIRKPYFELENGKLALKQTPVPFASEEQLNETPLQKILGRSFILSKIVAKAFPQWKNSAWTKSPKMEYTKVPIPKIACAIVEEFKRLADAELVKPVILVQQSHLVFNGRSKDLSLVVACAKKAGIPVVDLYPPLRDLFKADQATYNTLYLGPASHMTPKGNRFVAEQLHSYLRETDRSNSASLR